ncbi:uncharacterized protein LOC116131920 [Pistacia vera]|uniref:uncharacterized protein LOC116131920 n=1 Tax=Pistacia vera TaxID=55513 RepID=UPI0012636654|nr:uncharacterized protein LOC116131920 [Pistacia vera]
MHAAVLKRASDREFISIYIYGGLNRMLSSLPLLQAIVNGEMLLLVQRMNVLVIFYLSKLFLKLVEGVEGIMAAYANALHNVSLAGPTLFGQVINMAAQITGQSLSHDSSKYFVLLIITDGVLTDLQETKDALVRASDLPLQFLMWEWEVLILHKWRFWMLIMATG